MSKRIGRRVTGKLAAAVAAAAGVVAFAGESVDAGMMVDFRVTSINGQPLTGGDTEKSVLVAPGDQVQMKLVATVTGANDVDDDSMSLSHGSLISDAGFLPSRLLGNLAGGPVGDFAATGSQSGSNIDIDGDGDLDVGTTPDGGPGTEYFIARAPAQVQGSRVGDNAEAFHIGDFTFTVAADATGDTLVSFFPRRTTTGANTSVAAVWIEDGVGKMPLLSPYAGGAPVHIQVPEPSTLAVASLMGIGLLARRREACARE